MIEINLWKPCMDCEHADVRVVKDQYMYTNERGFDKCTLVTCSHADVCIRLDGAKPLIGGAS